MRTPIAGYAAPAEGPAENLFINSRAEQLKPYSGATVQIETDAAIPEIGATDAIRAYGTIGSNYIFGTLRNQLQSNFDYQPGSLYTASIWVKNNGSTAIIINVNTPDQQTVVVGPGQLQRCVFLPTKRLEVETAAQFVFQMGRGFGDEMSFDVTYWHPQIVEGRIDQPWTDDLYTIKSRLPYAKSVGTFVPYLMDRTDESRESYSCTVQEGYYFRVGNLVWFTATISGITGLPASPSSDRIRPAIGGLPYKVRYSTAVNLSSYYNICETTADVTANAMGSTKCIALSSNRGAGNAAFVADKSGAGYVLVSGMYATDDPISGGGNLSS